MLKIFFISISVILTLLLSIYKLVICKLKRTSKVSLYISIITGFLFFYIISAIVLSIFTPSVTVLLFGISPFIIGKFATYEKENFYSWAQIFLILFSIFYVLLYV